MSETNGVRGKKSCPKCGAVVGVRTQVCECGHQFSFKGKKASAPASKPAKQPARKASPVQAQVASFYKASDIANTLALVGEVRDLVSALGGPEATQAVLDRINALSAKVGGVDALKGILATVVPTPPKVEQPAPAVIVAPAPAPEPSKPAPAKRKKADKPAEQPASEQPASDPAPAPAPEGEAKVA